MTVAIAATPWCDHDQTVCVCVGFRCGAGGGGGGGGGGGCGGEHEKSPITKFTWGQSITSRTYAFEVGELHGILLQPWEKAGTELMLQEGEVWNYR